MALITAAVALGIAEALVCFGALYFGKWYFARILQRYEDRLMSEAAKLAGGQPCQSASVLIEVGRIIGGEAGRSAKASFMADLSHVQRNVNSAATDAALEGVSESQPALGAILGGMGKGKASKMLANPLVQLALQGFLANKGAAGPQNHSGSNGGSSPKSFSL